MWNWRECQDGQRGVCEEGGGRSLVHTEGPLQFSLPSNIEPGSSLISPTFSTLSPLLHLSLNLVFLEAGGGACSGMVDSPWSPHKFLCLCVGSLHLQQPSPDTSGTYKHMPIPISASPVACSVFVYLGSALYHHSCPNQDPGCHHRAPVLSSHGPWLSLKD